MVNAYFYMKFGFNILFFNLTIVKNNKIHGRSRDGSLVCHTSNSIHSIKVKNKECLQYSYFYDQISIP